MPSGRTPAQRLAGVAATALVLLFCLFPLWWMAVASLQREPEIFAHRLLPLHPVLDNYRLLLSDTYRFQLAIRNSLVIATATALITVSIGAGVGYALARLRVTGKPLILAGLLALAMFPGVSLLPGFYQLFSALGWLDAYHAVVIP